MITARREYMNRTTSFAHIPNASGLIIALHEDGRVVVRLERGSLSARTVPYALLSREQADNLVEYLTNRPGVVPVVEPLPMYRDLVTRPL